jgi:hypothetical protein
MSIYILNIMAPASTKPVCCPPPILKKKNMPYDGNITNSSITRAMRYSQIVRVTNGRNGSVQNVSNPAASNFASIAPPRNSF